MDIQLQRGRSILISLSAATFTQDPTGRSNYSFSLALTLSCKIGFSDTLSDVPLI